MSTADGHRLSPQARELLAFEVAHGGAERDPHDVEARRRDTREMARRFGGPAEPVASVEEVDAGGVPTRLYRPVGGERAALAWFHGGGWIMGDVDYHDAFCRALANRAACAVLNVGYRLAPQHPYPAAIDDAWAATRWATEHFERVAVGGDSAGGNLAASVALRARDARIALAHQLLVYPALDPRLEGPHVDDFVTRYARLGDFEGFGPDARDGVRSAWASYVPDAARRDEPDAAPSRAASLAGVAPATVVLVEHDILRGEGEAYAERLEREGVAVELVRYAEQVHGFFGMHELEDAREATERCARILRRAFAAAEHAEAPA